MLSSICMGCTRQEKYRSEMDIWLQEANFDAKVSEDELYQAAKEEDVLKVYTVSSRLFDVAESFQKQYPELLVEVIYDRAEEIKEKIVQNAEKKGADCDLIFITNGDGSLTEELIPNGLVYKYIPYDMKNHMREGSSEEYLSVLLEVSLLTFNDQYYDEPPIRNWWELTEEKWRGKVYITDPSRSMISYTMFAMFVKHTKEMEEYYEEYFGKKFESESGESAGETFIRLLIENDIQVVNDSDDVASAIAAPGSESSAVGILNASKLRLREQGYPMQVCYELNPFAGVINPANIMVVGGTKNVNTAKLFVRWILGEVDGAGDGYKPFLQEGAWPSRVDVTGDASRKLEDIKAIYTDEKFAYEYREKFLDFWNAHFE